MPYPHTFKPQTKVTVDDARGHTVADLDATVFKPLLACQFNGPQSVIVNHSLPNMAAAILRALVYLPAGGPLDIRPGPKYWAVGLVPSLTLSEDPNLERWWWSDAVPWVYAGGTLWSVYAHKDYIPPSPPPPPPPPATPIVLGATSASAALITFGVDYVAVLASGAQGWAYAPLATGIGDTIIMPAGTDPLLGTAGYGGTLMMPMAEGMALTGPGTISTPGAGHTGPDKLYQFLNPTASAVAVNFKATSP